VNGETLRDGSGGSDDAPTATLAEVLRANPGIGSREFELSAHKRGVSHNRTRRFLKDGVKLGKIQVNQVGKKLEHFLSDGYDSRLHRLHDNKRFVQVYDYIDNYVLMLARMYERRLKGYAAIGYVIEQEKTTPPSPSLGAHP